MDGGGVERRGRKAGVKWRWRGRRGWVDGCGTVCGKAGCRGRGGALLAGRAKKGGLVGVRQGRLRAGVWREAVEKEVTGGGGAKFRPKRSDQPGACMYGKKSAEKSLQGIFILPRGCVIIY